MFYNPTEFLHHKFRSALHQKLYTENMIHKVFFYEEFNFCCTAMSSVSANIFSCILDASSPPSGVIFSGPKDRNSSHVIIFTSDSFKE